MRKIILSVLLLMCSSAAWGDIEEFRYFSLDVPEGWTAEEKGSVVSVREEGGVSSLTITADSPGGKSIEELAKDFARELNGSDPEMDEDGAYVFEFDDGEGQGVIDGDEDLYLMIVGRGVEQNGEIMAEILASLEMK